MLVAVILISFILIACNAIYETDATQEKTNEFESQINKQHKI